MQKSIYIRLDAKDNVMVALQDLPDGMIIDTGNGSILRLTEKIPAKHKFFLQDLPPGSDIIMYGVLVGRAQQEITAGSRMNVFNTKHASDPYTYRGNIKKWQAPDISHFNDRTFNGYHRSDGRVGTANYWLFIPSVFCENRNLDVIREALHNELGYAVSDKYKRFTRSLVTAVKEGKNTDISDYAIFTVQDKKEKENSDEL